MEHAYQDDEAGSQNVRAALKNTEGFVNQTPVKRLHWLEALTGYPVYAKLEFQQVSGSFKFRGAWNALCQRRSREVIAASAGNHGLALATAGKMLGLNPKIVLPVGASRLKRNKLVYADAQLLEYGSSLAAAGRYARSLARDNHWDYISPFADERVIGGGATLVVEGIRQVEQVTSVFVPVGGGGLLTGAIRAKRYLGHSVEIHGAEPENYATVSACLSEGKEVEVLNRPTFADGLAVQLCEEETTLPVLTAAQFKLEAVSEEEIAASVVCLLQNESWLVEPSGAIGVAAVARSALQGRINGAVLILLTGGNVQKSTLLRVLSYPFSSRCTLARLLGLTGEAAHEKPEPKRISYLTPRRHADTRPALSDIHTVAAYRSWRERHEAAAGSLREYREFCRERQLPTPLDLVDTAETLLDLTRTVALRWAVRQPSATPFTHKATLRGLNILAGTVKRILDWRSPAYDQALVPQFFELKSQDNADVNYDRYGSPEVATLEAQLRGVFQVGDERVASTVTSSGMAAYALIESYLLRHRPGGIRRLAMAPYIYFEAAEQLTSLPFIQAVRFASFDADQIADQILEGDFDAVFVDPIANNVELRVCDIGRLLSRLRAQLDKPIVMVVDGTMASAELPRILFSPESLACEKLEILYYESCSKYLQLGLEYCLAGVVLHRVALRPNMERLRRNSGAILYAADAALFPRYTADEYAQHLACIGHNAATVAGLLANHPVIAEALYVHSPSLPSHVDYNAAQALRFTGGCLCLEFKEPGLNAPDQLNALIALVLAYAREADLPLVKGVSFGFATSRISAAAAIAASERPFLRLYVGIVSAEQAATLAEVFVRALIRFFASMRVDERP